MADELIFSIQDNVEEFLSKLETVTGQLDDVGVSGKAAGDAVAQGMNTAGNAAVVAGEKAGGLRGIFSEITAQAETMGTAFGRLGPMAEEGFGGAATAARSFGAVMDVALGPIGLLVAGLATLAAAFGFMKDSIGDAEAMQSSLATLGAAVKNQGGDWDAMKDSVEAWAKSESLASGISETQLIPALNKLVTAGWNVNDAMKAVGVAEEVAVSHHMALEEVTSRLMQAEAGRAMGLIKLDENLKPLILHHAHLSQVLQVLHRDNQNALSDNNSLAMANARLGAEFDILKDAIGSAFLPVLTNMATEILGLIKMFGDWWTSFKELVSGLVGGAGLIGDAFNRLGNILFDALHGKTADIPKQLNALKSEAQNVGSELAKSFVDYGTAFRDYGQAFQNGLKMADDAIKKHQQALGDLSLQNDAVVGTPAPTHKKKGAHPYENSNSYQQAADLFAKVKDAAKGFDEQLSDLTGSVDKSNASVASYTAELTKLQALETQVTSAEEHANAVAANKIAVYEQTRAQYNAYISSLKNGQPQTKQEAEIVKLLADNMKKAGDAAENAQKQHEALAAELKKVDDAITQTKGDVGQYAAAWNKFYAEQQQKYQEDLATFNMTNEQKLVYYKQLVASITVVDQASLQAKEQAYQQELAAYKAILKQQQDAQQAAIKQMDGYVSTFVTDIENKNEGFKSFFESMLKDMLGNFNKMVEQMIEKWLFGINTMQSDSSKAGSQNSSGGGLLGSLFQGLTGGSGGSSPPVFGTGTGSTTNQNGTSAIDSQGLADPTTAAVISANTTASPLGVNVQQVAGLSAQNSTGGSGGASLGGIGMGLGVASMLDSAMGPGTMNSTWSQVGGGVLGGVGGALYGPGGAAAGSLIGSLIGGLFGPHETAADQPDQSEPTMNFGGSQINFGQLFTDLTGTSAANIGGQQFEPGTQFNTALGNQNLANQLMQWEGSVQQSTLTPLEQKQVAQLTALGNLNNPDEHQGMFTFASGQSMSVSQFMNLVSEVSQIPGAPGSSAANANLDVYSIVHGTPNLNQTSLQTAGTYNIQTGTYSNAGAGSTVNLTPGSNNGVNLSNTTVPGTPNITINIAGSVVGPGGVNQLTNVIQQAWYRMVKTNSFNSLTTQAT